MALTLKIENHSSLPDGGPLSFTLNGQRSADIGRDQHLDWSLPDPQRFISGKHCEIKYHSGEYMLIDVSTNGTFVNGALTRVQSPYRLKHGDRLQIGDYLIGVSITGEARRASDAEPGAARPTIDRPQSNESLWDVGGEVAPPIDPRELRPRGRPSPVFGDFLSQTVDAPRIGEAAQFIPVEQSLDWAPLAPRPVPREESPRAPEPRRRASFDEDGWSAPPDMAAHAPPEAQAGRASAVASPDRSDPPFAPVRGDQGALRGGSDLFMHAFASAAGIPQDLLSSRSPEELGALMGKFALIVAGELQQLLQARVEAKRIARSGEYTLIQPQENNPLKFTPTPQDALRIMFGPPTRSYLDALDALEASFADLKRHQLQTYAAMQQAVKSLFDALDPEQLDKNAPKLHGAESLFKARKAQLWDAFLAAWKAQTKGQSDGVINQFMLLFGSFYDRAGDG
ncbi:type VI secretion system-associated FHA domain protein TagH [Rhodoblastus sp. 17X3]|uniref:type VI secretion system-associated FHA domain protein TagH n=1 Tax=Rhodoblastus sp. 17X3 TaxID=3047026 RepID=UPI0024B6EBF7|nr:type VI secretion system-associated FHA domain protein TagH [Rhodoblastus sp. 17X3]MDI9849779.1 type VI secretion system-associated FHA domain protein TagH [Rhodoblastus sp. 17X3]